MDIQEKRLQALLDERRLLCADKLEAMRTAYRVILAFISVAAVTAGLFWSQRIVNDPDTRAVLTLLLSQVAVILGAVIVALTALVAKIAGYVAAIEDHLNLTLGVYTNIWETHVGQAFWHWKDVSFWSVAVVIVLFLSGAVVLVMSAATRFNHFGFGFLIMLEAAVLIAVTVSVFHESQRARTLAGQYLGRPYEKPSAI